MLLVLLVIGVVWVLALVLALALCAAARMGDADLDRQADPVVELRAARTCRFRGSVA